MFRNTLARMRNTLLRGENSLDSRGARRTEIPISLKTSAHGVSGEHWLGERYRVVEIAFTLATGHSIREPPPDDSGTE